MIETFSHILPPLPEEEDKSNKKESHAPIFEGDDTTIVGDMDNADAVITIDDVATGQLE
jgi:hypothetical protein